MVKLVLELEMLKVSELLVFFSKLDILRLQHFFSGAFGNLDMLEMHRTQVS